MDFEKLNENFLGYPCNLAYDYTSIQSNYKYLLNNVGDPYSSSTYKLNTKDIERDVLAFFADLWGFDKDTLWGYISASGTISNLNALYVAREAYPDGILYTSEDSHYSVFKAAKVLKLPIVTVKSQDNGEIDYKEFERQVKLNINNPVIVNANIGTTMKGAIDDTKELYSIICNNKKQDHYFMHGDGALSGIILPFLDKHLFYKRPLHSLAISGHKFLGLPMVCSIFMMDKRFLRYVNQDIEYIGSNDATLMGSRDGHPPLLLDYIIKHKGKEGFERDIMNCIENTEFLINELMDKTKGQANAWRNTHSITAVFNKPSAHVIQKWQLATERNISHAVVLPHVNRLKIKTFVNDYSQSIRFQHRFVQ